MPRDRNFEREQTLRRAVLRGEDGAWEELYEGSFDALMRFVYIRVNRDRDLTDEIVQEVWMVAVRKIRQFDPSACRFETWLRGVAKNVMRNASRRPRFMPPSTEEEMAASNSGLEDREMIALAMTELPSNYQAVLRARYHENRSVEEIASHRETTLKSVESLLSRAREAFRQAYRRLDDKEEPRP